MEPTTGPGAASRHVRGEAGSEGGLPCAGETELHVRETEDSEGVLPVADLAELIFGRVMPEELSDREGVILTEHLAGELKKITKLTRVCFNEIV